MYQENSGMNSEFTSLSWKVSAIFIGGSLPLILFGKAILATWFSIGLIFGGLAMLENRPKWKEIKDIFFSNIAKVTFVMLLIFASSALNSVDQHYSLVRVYEMFYLCVASGLLVLVLTKMPREYVYLSFKVLSLSTLVISLLVLLDSFFESERLSVALHGNKWKAISKLEQMSSVIAILAPFFWTWVFNLTRKDYYWAKKVGLAGSYLLFFSVIVCGGLAGWLAVFVGALAYLVIGGKWHALALRTKHWALLPFAVFLAFLGYFTASGFQRLQSSEFLQNQSTYVELVQDSLDYLAASPVVGVGVNATRFLPNPEALVAKSNSQNFLVQLLLETGVLGLLVTTILFFMVLRRLYKYAHVNTYGLAGISSMLAFLAASMANTSIFNAWWLAFFIALSSLSIRMCKN